MYAQEIPDYYLGYLMFYDQFSDDNCRWVVYDGLNRVRCPTRASAVDYINQRHNSTANDVLRLMTSARLHVDAALKDLDRASRFTSGPQKLLLERLSVRLRPFVVDLDNCIIQ